MTTQSLEIQKHDNVSPVLASPDLPQVHQPASPSTPGPSHNQSRAFAIESLKRKQRADSFFRGLPPAQQDKLVHWLDTEKDLVSVLDRVTAPPPGGLGLNVHLTSLRRLRAHWRAMIFADRNQEILDEIHDMETNSDFSQAHRIQEGINQLLHEKAFELARTHPGSDVFSDVLASIARLAELQVQTRKTPPRAPKTPAPRSSLRPASSR